MSVEQTPAYSLRSVAGAKSTVACSSYAPYVGRIGALAVALGIGSAMMSAAVAHADTTGTDSSAGSSQSNSARSARHSTATSSTPRTAVRQDSSRSRSRTVAPHATAAKPVAATRTAASTPSTDSTADQSAAVAVALSAAAAPADGAGTQTVSAARTTTNPVTAISAVMTAARTTLESLVQNVKPPAFPSVAQLLASLLAWTRKEFEAIFGAPDTEAAATPGTGTVATGTTTVTIEGETLILTPTKAGSTYTDTAASGRKALLLSTNGSAAKTLSLPSTSSLVIRARGDQYNGAPVMTVSIDGQVVSTTQVTSTSWADYTIPVSVSAGTHTISIAFTNDLKASGSQDRNLRIDKITVVPASSSTTQTPPYFQAADWLWKPIVANPVIAANSATWVSYLSAVNTKHVADLYDYGVTLVQATASTPRYDVTFTEAWGNDPMGSYTVAIPLGLNLPGGSDRQIAILDPTTGKAYGLWRASYDSATNTWTAAWGGITDLNGNGVDTSGSATGTNIARYAGVITTAEFSAAVAANTGINHALFISSDLASALFTGPATKSDGTNMAGVSTPIPEGTRIQLDPSINVDAIPGITAAEKVIAKTLQTYGAYVGDQGGARMAFIFEVAPDATSTDPGAAYTAAGLQWDYYDMAAIPWSKLRVLANWDGS
ncbi:putative xylan-binding protein with Ca-dependent carbohydrate-binding module [Mycobacterium sp. BK086]|uniref:carbohydrate-binding domain-containing protein n=1 Tax=Mycobacterium sp. BK086 TaxID=2512165 RepID=UPI00105EBBF2|nr:carbohydrate-binding domain-containing protein [Mycobacterium sp. BK086]TDO12141.1 putative xylan-binding protein with Ca-dependent carbohydrate-binding module [Mycobacterium sp. BK086]